MDIKTAIPFIIIGLAVLAKFIHNNMEEGGNLELFIHILLISVVSLSITKPYSAIESPKVTSMTWGDEYKIKHKSKNRYYVLNRCSFQDKEGNTINASCEPSDKLIIGQTYHNVQVSAVELSQPTPKILTLNVDSEVIYSYQYRIYLYHLNLVVVCGAFLFFLYKVFSK